MHLVVQLVAAPAERTVTRLSMKRDDWVFVGMRLLGIYFIAVALAGLPTLLIYSSETQLDAALMLQAAISFGVRLLIGAVLCMKAPAILGWLKKKDSRLTGSAGKVE